MSATDKMNWTRWITADANVSIGLEEHHCTPKNIIDLFFKDPGEIRDPKKIYLLKTIFSESSLQAIYDFLKESGIGFARAKSHYLAIKKKTGAGNAKLDWFFGV